ncbi:Intracellular distribution of mitochondria [Quaeritorhiza haematococci]|nr:Intracellular distribution of mitochondria [Quaeritorhiza haematococci]
MPAAAKKAPRQAESGSGKKKKNQVAAEVPKSEPKIVEDTPKTNLSTKTQTPAPAPVEKSAESNGSANGHHESSSPVTAPVSSEEVATSEVVAADDATIQDINAVVEEQTFQLTVMLPNNIGKLEYTVTPHVTIGEIRQLIYDTNDSHFYTCFYFAFDENSSASDNSKTTDKKPRLRKLNDMLELGAIEGFTPDSVLHLVEDVYNDREVRVHIARLREILTNFQTPVPPFGVDPASSFLSSIAGDLEVFPTTDAKNGTNTNTKSKKHNNKSRHGNAKSGANAPVVQLHTPTSLKDVDGKHVFDQYSMEGDSYARAPLSQFVPEPFVHNNTVANQTQCVRSFVVSPWNPPPPPRRLAGDIMYIIVTTLEGDVLHITCSASGFYISNSSGNAELGGVFDPTPRAQKSCFSHTLPGCLSQASPAFAVAFPHIVECSVRRHPYEYVLTNAGAYPWCVKSRPHHSDSTRVLDVQLTTQDAIESYTSRDWNEDLQSARELPQNTAQEKIFRDSTIAKQQADFVEAAIRGVLAIASKSLIPLNPLDPESSQMYLHNNIFFSQGHDGREQFEKLGGTEAAHVAFSKDIEGVRMLNNLDIDGYFTLGTAVIDYKGQRVVAQTIVPGILKKTLPLPVAPLELENSGEEKSQQEQEEQHMESTTVTDDAGQPPVQYGSVDGGKTIYKDEQFHELAARIGKALHFAEHEVVDEKGDAYSLYTSVDSKGILGADGRKYFLDLYRTTPVDVTFLEDTDKETADEISKITATKKSPSKSSPKKNNKSKNAEKTMVEAEGEESEEVKRLKSEYSYPHRMCLLRPELVEIFYDHKLRVFVTEKRQEQAQKAQESAEKTEHQDEEKQDQEESEKPSTDEPTTPTIDEELLQFDLRLNPDAFTSVQYGIPQDEESKDKPANPADALVREASEFLKTTVLSNFVLELLNVPSNTPVDGESLTKMLHRRGVNVRYIGRLASIVNSLVEFPVHYIKDLLHQEMVARAAKRVLRELLRETPMFLVGHCISHFLNCLYSDPTSTESPNPATDPVHQHFLSSGAVTSSETEDSQLAYLSLTPKSLHERLTKEIRRRFRYQFAASSTSSSSSPAPTAATEDEKVIIPKSTLTVFDVVRMRRIPLLRSVCLKAGIQIEARDYDFEALAVGAAGAEVKRSKQVNGAQATEEGKAIFYPKDIVNLVPLVKHAEPRSAFAEEAHEHGRIYLAQGQKEIGQELITEALTLYEQVYGPVHPETGRAYAQLAMINFHNQEADLAKMYQRKAVIVTERTQGVDDPDTLQQYMNLAFFEHMSGNTELGLKLMKHAIYYWEMLCSGSKHPESASADANIGNMLQNIRNFDLAARFFERAAKTNEEILGKSHHLTTNSFESLNRSHILRGDFRSAVQSQKAVYYAYKARFGDDHPRTKEAEKMLKGVCDRAVEDARREKEEAERKGSRRALKGGKQQQQQQQQTEGSSQEQGQQSGDATSKGHLPLDELLQFLGETPGSAGKKKKPSEK